VIMEVAKIIREDFLQQNAFSDYDFTCPLVKSVGMLRSIILFYNLSQKAIADSPPDAKVTWAQIKTSMNPVLQKIIQTKFQLPKQPEAELKAFFSGLDEEVEQAFQTLSD
ncbi:putative V-type proton ATPase catalytic subunit A (V-ATPase subunit A), partial [Phytophthora infestans]